LQRGRQRRNNISQAARFCKRRSLGRDHQDAGHTGIVPRALGGQPIVAAAAFLGGFFGLNIVSSSQATAGNAGDLVAGSALAFPRPRKQSQPAHP
jgi:hypothetical protein